MSVVQSGQCICYGTEGHNFVFCHLDLMGQPSPSPFGSEKQAVGAVGLLAPLRMPDDIVF